MKEGFTEVTIPAKTYKSCFGCNYYEHEMIKSGNNPEYSHHCKHPDLSKLKYRPFAAFRGNLPNEDKTPLWCPFLKNENK